MDQRPQAPKVLVVEDEWVIRSMIADELRELGLAVVEAANGRQALAELQADGFAALITDVNMPGSIDGIDVAARAKETHPSMLVVVVSAGHHSPARLAVADVVERKPADIHRLAKLVLTKLQSNPPP